MSYKKNYNLKTRTGINLILLRIRFHKISFLTTLYMLGRCFTFLQNHTTTCCYKASICSGLKHQPMSWVKNKHCMKQLLRISIAYPWFIIISHPKNLLRDHLGTLKSSSNSNIKNPILDLHCRWYKKKYLSQITCISY